MSINPILLQKTIRDNAADLHDFAKDLKSWGEEMKRKEEALKNDEQSSSVKKVPKEPKIFKQIKRNDKPKTPITKIGATDYAAWDKFNVDEELERLEGDIQDESDLTDECNENMYDDAIVEKEKGNKFVKNQKWDEAIICYTKAIECYSYDSVFYANRALCYLKLSKFEACEKDCNLALKLDDTYVKAYQRRAAARMQLNKLELAEIDLKKVLVLEPKNKEARTELDKLSLLLRRNQGEVPDQRPVSKFTASRMKSNMNTNFKTVTPIYQPPKETTQLTEKHIDDSTPFPLWTSDPEILEVKAIKKPPHLRSQKPLKRIEITEIEGIEVEPRVEHKVKTPKIEEPVKQHVFENTRVSEKQQESSNKPVSAFKKDKKLEKLAKQTDKSTPLPKNIEKSSPFPKIIEKSQESLFKKQKGKLIEEIDSSTPLPNPENKLQFLRTEDLKVVEKLNPPTTPKDVKNTVNDTKKLIENNETNNNFNYPKNTVQFCTSWKNFKTIEDKYKYLKLIIPSDLPRIFLNSLDSALFSNILEVMVQHFIQNGDNIYDVLSYFTEVKRFGAIAMFMSGEDKSNVWKLLDHIKENKEKENEDVDRLIAKYEL